MTVATPEQIAQWARGRLEGETDPGQVAVLRKYTDPEHGHKRVAEEAARLQRKGGEAG